jgi:hypothetical protein
MRATQHDARLTEREAQSRGWAAPLPDLTALPRVGETPRIRLEWETRDTMNNRLWADVQVTGAKAVTSAMLAAHPTAGAEAWMPTAARNDRRSYVGWGDPAESHHGIWSAAGTVPVGGAQGVGFSHMPGAQERPTAPVHGAWMGGTDAESVNAAREVRGVVKETLAGREEDASARASERLFQNQWLTREDQQRIVTSQMAAAEALRPGTDDFRVSYRR